MLRDLLKTALIRIDIRHSDTHTAIASLGGHERQFGASLIPVLGVVVCVFCLATPIEFAAAQNSEPEIIPRLRSWTGGTGNFGLSTSTRIVVNPSQASKSRNGQTQPGLSTQTVRQVADVFKNDIAAVDNLTVAVVETTTLGNGDIVFNLDSTLANIGPEGYQMDIGANGRTTINAKSSTGLFYATRTLLQILRQQSVSQFPVGTIKDYPTQTARLVMLDAGRKYWDITYIKNLMRQMSWMKANVLFLHIAEGEAFRLYDSAFSELADPSLSYSQQDIADLDDFANEHHITIMPGFELPGHATVVSDAYDIGFGDGPNPCTNAHIQSHLTINFVIDMTSATARSKVNEILNNFVPWFDGPYVHVGGDEVSGLLANCQRVRKYIADTSGISSLGDLLLDFINGVDNTVNAHNKKTVIFEGWQHLNHPQKNPNSDIIMMTWEASPMTGYTQFRMAPYQKFFLTPNNYHKLYPDQEWLYKTWVPTTTNLTAGTTILGSGIPVWADYNFQGEEGFFENFLAEPRAILADRSWNGSPTAISTAAFRTRIDTVGAPPGYTPPPGPKRSPKGEMMHRYTFNDVAYPSGYHPTGRSGQTLWAEDTKEALSGTSYIIQNPTVEPGVVGGSFDFQNNGDGVGFGGQDLGPPWTLSFWVKKTGTVSDGVVLNSPAGAIKLEQFSTSSRVGFTKYGVADYSFNYTAPQGAWTYITLTAEDSMTSLYVNGVFHSQVSNTIDLPRMSIGRVGALMRGQLDEMMVFGEALSASEIADLHTVTRPTHRWGFDEGTGTTVADQVGSSNGTVNGATFVDGVRVTSKALEFDGLNDEVSISVTDLTGDWTVGAWVYKHRKHFSSSLVSGTSSAVRIDQYYQTGKAGFTQFGVADYVSTYAVPEDIWVYLTFVRSGTNVQVYANGSLQSTFSGGAALSSINRIGSTFVNNSTTDYLDGRLDDLIMFDEALTASQVAMLYTIEGL